jgi:spermidine synthase
MNSLKRRVLFVLFFVSGFCALVYQVVWTRLAFASFGITAPVLSVVISIFMLGLMIGSWTGGKWIGPLARKTRFSAIYWYALAELVIGIGAFAVPKFFAVGENFLLASGETDSFHYLFLSALVLALSILPWCLCMGTTYPFMMAYVLESCARQPDSFSFLYLANVSGAMSGTLLSAMVLVEVLGFKYTLWFAAAGNLGIVAIAGMIAVRDRKTGVLFGPIISEGSRRQILPLMERLPVIKWILFSSGFSVMAMEVVWARAFTPILKTQVYAFAMIVFVYLGATFFGSLFYRLDLRRKSLRSTAELMSILSVAAFLPIVCNDLRFVPDTKTVAGYLGATFLLGSIWPLCAALGYLTPKLIDKGAAGQPLEAGKAYAINVLGCIIGPLFASYVLLPTVRERIALVILGLPFVGFFLFGSKSLSLNRRVSAGIAAALVLTWSLFYAVDFGDFASKNFRNVQIRRDYAASVVSEGEGLHKALFVNGMGMTALVPLTKFMAHLPLALHTGKPESALIICFGMGTSYRSALSWNLDTTAVELVPSVRKAFGFYHADAAAILQNPNGHIIIDDGRRYLMRTRDKFDVIIIDPPPPVEAAGSSLLYSKEFYALAKAHLKTNGILQAWFPGGDDLTEQAIVRSLCESFSHVRFFHSIGGWGLHMLGSGEPIEIPNAQRLSSRVPAAAARDLLEWSPSHDLAGYLELVLTKEVPSARVLNPDQEICVTDDRPYNEYFLLRHWGLF